MCAGSCMGYFCRYNDLCYILTRHHTQLTNHESLIGSRANPIFYDVAQQHIEQLSFASLFIDMEPVKKRQRLFLKKTEDELQQLLDMKEAKNTKKATMSAVNIFRSYCIERQKPESFENFPAEELANTLRFFYAEVTKKGGELYKKSSLNCIREGIARHLKKERNIDIIEDLAFNSANNVFRAQLVELKRQGKGATEHKQPVDEKDLKKLYDSFDISTPRGLQQKVWVDIMLYLIRRGRENLRQMTKNTFEINVDASGKRYVRQAVDEMDKNHRGNCDRNATMGEGRMYENLQSVYCPVKAFEKYISKLHPDLEALWQRPRESPLSDNENTWYCRSPVGENKLGNMMKDMSLQYKLSKIYTNHCLRSTAIEILNVAGFNDREIMKISGHTSATSLQSYHNRITEKCKENISNSIGKAISCSTPIAKDGKPEEDRPLPISPVSSISLRSPPGSPLVFNFQQSTSSHSSSSFPTSFKPGHMTFNNSNVTFNFG